MDLSHRFSVPAPLEETWSRFEDIAALAECFPGATVTSVDGDTFSGTVKVKLGPIAMVYSGSGTFVDRDDVAHTFKVDAKGKDKRGNGTAGAKVDVAMTAGGSGTDVSVVTDLAITGKPAQFGRGVMQDVSDKLLAQFVACLESRLGEPAPDGSEPVLDAQPVTEPRHVADPATAPTAPAAAPRHVAGSDEALDLGSAVLPVLLKSYWKPAAGAIAVLLAILWWRRR